MQLLPLMDRVVVKQVETEEVSPGGIILTSAAKEKPQFAEVIAVGPGGMVDGKEVAMQVKAGDRVVILSTCLIGNNKNRFLVMGTLLP